MSLNIILHQAIYLQFCFDLYTFIFWLFRSDTLQVLIFVCITVQSFAFMDVIILVFWFPIRKSLKNWMIALVYWQLWFKYINIKTINFLQTFIQTSQIVSCMFALFRCQCRNIYLTNCKFFFFLWALNICSLLTLSISCLGFLCFAN